MEKVRLLLIAVALLLTAQLKAQVEKHQAIYLMQFAKNIGWPPEDDGKDLIVTVIGDADLAEALKPVSGKRIGNRKIVVNKSQSTSLSSHSDIIYLGQSKSSSLSTLATSQSGQKSLIVSSGSGNCARGACITLVQVGNKLSFEISESNIKKRGLGVSPKLLGLGKSVD